MATWNELPEHLKSRVKEFSGNKTSGVTTDESFWEEETPQQRTQALGRLPAGRMNNTEKKYAARLETLKHAGEIIWWAFEPINIRLAPNCYYRVDFMVMLASGEIQAHETKGFWTDDARVKIKVAASLFPIQFLAAKLVGGNWEFEYF